MLKGIDYFEEAIERDPSYALAYAGLADSYGLLVRYTYISPDEGMPKGKTAALKALEIDDTLAEAYTSLAFIKRYYDFDWQGAELEYKRAIEFSPNYATAHHWYALHLVNRGLFEEAFSEIRRAQELDPLSMIINTNVAWTFYFARQYDQATEQFLKTLEMDPNYAVAHQRLGATYLQKNIFTEAIEEFKKAVALSPESTEFLATLGHSYAVSGDRVKAEGILNQLKKLSRNRYVSDYDLAMIYLGLGDKERTFEYLEKAYEKRSSFIAYIQVDPRLDSLRSDPRFNVLLKKLGLK